jgi:hypothetical protein
MSSTILATTPGRWPCHDQRDAGEADHARGHQADRDRRSRAGSITPRPARQALPAATGNQRITLDGTKNASQRRPHRGPAACRPSAHHVHVGPGAIWPRL